MIAPSELLECLEPELQAHCQTHAETLQQMTDGLNASREFCPEAVCEMVGLESYGAWLRRVSPNMHWDWPHLVAIQKSLDCITLGYFDRLLISMPPRHGKSEVVTIRYPVYRMAMKPQTRAIVASYGDKLSYEFASRSKRVARAARLGIGERDTGLDWETSNGSSYQGLVS